MKPRSMQELHSANDKFADLLMHMKQMSRVGGEISPTRCKNHKRASPDNISTSWPAPYIQLSDYCFSRQQGRTLWYRLIQEEQPQDIGLGKWRNISYDCPARPGALVQLSNHSWCQAFEVAHKVH